MRTLNSSHLGVVAALSLALGAASDVCAQTPPQHQPNSSAQASTWEATRKKASEISGQPARDIGASKREIPPVLQRAYADPYNVRRTKDCKFLLQEISSLNEILGSDYDERNKYSESKVGKLAEAGGKTIVNSIIPFRGVIREVTGAAPDDRRMSAAVDAGLARRGFLRGISYRQGCRKY